MNDLSRFKKAQDYKYNDALSEISKGRKETHWMWYIFPQIKGLGRSNVAVYYSIRDLEEAKAYLEDEELKNKLNIITSKLLDINNKSIIEIFGEVDSMKLRSSMTLFYYISKDDLYKKIIDKYFNGFFDKNTLKICELLNSKKL